MDSDLRHFGVAVAFGFLGIELILDLGHFINDFGVGR